MNTIKISPNIYIIEDANFGTYNKNIVYRLLKQVQIDFASWIGNIVYQTSNCLVFYKDECPTIYDIREIGHRVCLHVNGDDWWRWTYQFAHEYCHHLINGPMSGGIKGLLWFEETMCDLSSIFHLRRLIALCDVFQINSLLQYKIYARSCLHANLGTVQENCQEYLKQHMVELEQPVYHREIYSNLSATMLPLFVENPNLWKMILHIGDSRRWTSLEDLFVHLHRTSDNSYSHSLTKLENLLIS